MIDIVEYLDANGKSPFAGWFDDLDGLAATKVTIALSRIGQGNLSNVKALGSGLLEYRIHFGPGYRVYFGRRGDRLVILLAGGTKRRQDSDVERARARWDDYQTRLDHGPH